MGRKLKYTTKKEQHEAQLRWQREHYNRNKIRILKTAKERYYRKKVNQIKLERGRKLYDE